MKKIIFVRHGKAEDHDTHNSDLLRSLTKKGKMVAGDMADKLAEKEREEYTFITSLAFRAVETAIIFADKMHSNYDNIIIRNIIYGNLRTDSLIMMLEELGNETDSVILFGHNPSFSMLVDKFSDKKYGHMPTSGIACIAAEVNRWSDVTVSNSRLLYSISPDGTDR